MRIPRTRTLTRLLAGAVIVTTPLLAGCGTATSTSTTANRAGSGGATTPGAGRTATSATTSKTTTAAATPTGGPGECRAAELVLTYLGGQGATGHGDLGFALRNKGRRSCHTYGYPGIRFLDRAGKALPTVPTHSTEDFFGHRPLRALSVAPGASVSFRLDVSHGSGSRGRCPTAAALAVIPPDDTRALSTSITNGAYECAHAIVSPLQPGLTAHP